MTDENKGAVVGDTADGAKADGPAMQSLTAEEFAERLAKAQALVGKTITYRFVQCMFNPGLAITVNPQRVPTAVVGEIKDTDFQVFLRVSNLHGPIPPDRIRRALTMKPTHEYEAEVVKVWCSDPDAKVFTIEASEREPLMRFYRDFVGKTGKEGDVYGRGIGGNDHGYMFYLQPGVVGFLAKDEGFTRDLVAAELLSFRVKEVSPEGVVILTAPKKPDPKQVKRLVKKMARKLSSTATTAGVATEKSNG